MALFFYTHDCNPICAQLHLTPFDLSALERERLLQKTLASPVNAATVCRGSEKPFSDVSRLDLYMQRFRHPSAPDESDGYGSATSSSLSLSSAPILDRSVSVPQADLGSTTRQYQQAPLSASMTRLRISSSSIAAPVSQSSHPTV